MHGGPYAWQLRQCDRPVPGANLSGGDVLYVIGADAGGLRSIR